MDTMSGWRRAAGDVSGFDASRAGERRLAVCIGQKSCDRGPRTQARTTASAAVAVVLMTACAALGQSQPPEWISVPLAGCDCSPPTDVDPCCDAGAGNSLACWRMDMGPTITLGGIFMPLESEGTCDTCPPDGCCPLPGPLTCTNFVSASFTQSASATISGNIEAGIPGITAKLGAALGVQVGTTTTVSQECSVTVSGCKEQTGKAKLNVWKGKTAKIDHEWRLEGVWGTVGDCDSTCPIAGSVWFKPCGTGMSTGIADLAAKAGCETTSVVEWN